MKVRPPFYYGLALLLAVFSLAISGCGRSQQEAVSTHQRPYRVGLSLWVSHPIIFELRDGFVDRLKEIADSEGFKVEFDEKNAEGQAPQLSQISAYFTRGRHDLIYSIGAPATLNLKALEPTIPVLFAGVPDPVRNGFVKSLDHPSYGMTGARFLPPADVIFEAFKMAYPEARSIAILRNPGEVNSVSTAEPVINLFEARGFKVMDYAVTEAPQFNALLQQIRNSGADALFVPTDNLVYQNLKRVVQECQEMGIPLISVTDAAVQMGADFSVGVPYYRIGEITAEMAAEILTTGKSANDVPVREINKGFLYLSKDEQSKFSDWDNPSFPIKVVE